MGHPAQPDATGFTRLSKVTDGERLAAGRREARALAAVLWPARSRPAPPTAALAPPTHVLVQNAAGVRRYPVTADARRDDGTAVDLLFARARQRLTIDGELAEVVRLVGGDWGLRPRNAGCRACLATCALKLVVARRRRRVFVRDGVRVVGVRPREFVPNVDASAEKVERCIFRCRAWHCFGACRAGRRRTRRAHSPAKTSGR